MCGSEHRPFRFAAGLLALVLAAALPAAAQNSREAGQVRRLRQQVQQLQTEAAGRQQAQAELQRRLAAAEAELKQQKDAAAAQSRAAGQARRELGEAAQQRQALGARAGELQTALESERSTSGSLRGELERTKALYATLQDNYAALAARHKTQAEGLQACIARNDELHALGGELLDRYENKGFGEVFGTREPFVQHGRVTLENLVQGYRDKLDAQALAAPR